MNEDRFTVFFLTFLACGIVIGAMISLPPVMSPNDASQWNTVWSLNAGQGYVIDGAPYETFEKVVRAGRSYSSKPALMPTVVAGLAWLTRRPMGLSIPQDDGYVFRIVLILINVLPFAAMVVLYARLLERLDCQFPARIFCVAAAAFGTYLTGYSVTLNSHTLAACAVFFALYCLIRVQYDGQRHWGHFFLCGLFAAWAAANEAPALLFVAIVSGILLRANPRAALLYFLPPVLALCAAFFGATWLATGGLLPYASPPEPEVFFYKGRYWLNPFGFAAADDSAWLRLFHMLLGRYGILSLTPIFVFAFYGALLKARLQLISRIGLLLTIGMLGFYALGARDYGGRCQGMPRLFWLIPFWLISLAPAVDRAFRSPLFRALAFAALLVSLVSVGFALGAGGPYKVAGPWGLSWLHQAFWPLRSVNY